MNRFVRCFAALLVLALALAGQAAFAKEDEMWVEKLYFTPGQDLVVYDNPKVTITLKGNQPARTYADGYDLDFLIENRESKSIMASICATANGNIELQDFRDLSSCTVMVPANGSEIFTIHMNPSLLKEYNDGEVSEAKLSEIKNFEGIYSLDITHDSWYVDGSGLISVSYLAEIYF